MPAEPYPLPDEPKPGALSHLVVQPFWPLLSVMLVGPWLAWPWFVVNALALGSPHVGRQVGLVAGGFAGTGALLVGLGFAMAAGLPDGAAPYLAIALTVWKLGVTYALFTAQSRTMAIHELYDGVVKNGGAVLLAAWFLGSRVVEPALEGLGMVRVVLLP